MNIVISQPMFFPWVGIFEQIRIADIYVDYNDVQFSKGSFTNRVQIKTAYGVKWLSVPLARFNLGDRINEVQVDTKQDWKHQHLRQLSQAYESAQYRKDMLALVEQVYEQPHVTIGQLSHNSMIACCTYYGLHNDRKFVDVRDLRIQGKSSERVRDIVARLAGSRYITGLGAKNYLNHDLLESSNIRVEYMNYRKMPYPQLHGAFTPYVSLLDLIANTGPHGLEYICSKTIYWRDFIRDV